jgi:uncharacterized protein
MQKKELFGRPNEQKILLDYCKSLSSEMIAIVGRRRIGKTYLIRRTLAKELDFEMTGYQYATKAEQLQNFVLSLSNFTNTAMITQPPKNWLEAFHQLKQYLILKKGNKKKVIFIDELPWIATSKSGFVEALAHFWNDWASENNVLLIICGSAASWMLKNVVNNKGGLHNRIHHTIYLQPFTLNETKQFLQGNRIKATDKEILQLYMVLGGVPYYLSLLEKGKSIAQNIDELLFAANGKLAKEYDNIFLSLFDKASKHVELIQILAGKWKGFTRNEIATLYKGTDGGTLTSILEELTLSGFITKYPSFQKSAKDALFRITDPYLLFYLKYLRKKNTHNTFTQLMSTQSYKAWCGYAFENICFYHLPQIYKQLKITKLFPYACSYFFIGNKNTSGFQIDMLIVRADGVIHLCEIKYYDAKFLIDKKYCNHLLERVDNFTSISKTKNTVFLTMVTNNGLIKNEYSKNCTDIELTQLDLFT